MTVDDPSGTRPATIGAESGTVAAAERFLWGVATSAYQIEGAVHEGGRGESIWDRFCHTGGNVARGENADVACDHYHRWEDDLDLMASLGVGAYRFSVGWPRIQPEGRGRPNPTGLDFYRQLVNSMLERGIVPMLTLYHWDLPQALQDRGGWADRDTAKRFADFAEITAQALGDAVPLWVTHNEPWVSSMLGHALGIHAPGLRDWPLAFRCAHHVLLSHGLAAEAVRAGAHQAVRVGIALDHYPIHPAGDGPEDEQAARLMDGFRNRWFLDPVLVGSYPSDVMGVVDPSFGPFDFIEEGDLVQIGAPLDFLGVNYYTRSVVRDGPGNPPVGAAEVPPDGQRTKMGWEVYPEGLDEALERIHRDYGPIPLFVTENGAAVDDTVDAAGTVNDPDRVSYLEEHLAAAQRAIDAGVDLRGYFVWSLMDNFEWDRGYEPRFGLVRVDYPTQTRTLKDSAGWYREFIVARGDGLAQGSVSAPDVPAAPEPDPG